jgi:hypothetical protein
LELHDAARDVAKRITTLRVITLRSELFGAHRPSAIDAIGSW